MSGLDAIDKIHTFSLESGNVYRSQTLTQSYNLRYTDQTVAAAGAQTLSFHNRNGTLQERIDRHYLYDSYWEWAFPDLRPVINYSMVLQGGHDGFACFNSGQNSFFSGDPTAALGFADGFLTDYLVQQAHQYALPWLLQRLISDAEHLNISTTRDTITDNVFLSIDHQQLGLSLILNNTSCVPHLVRSRENDPIFGPSTTDVAFTNYSIVSLPGNGSSILLPHRMQTVYNSINVIEDFIIDKYTLNPVLSAKFFEPHASANGQGYASPPRQSAIYPRSEVHQFYEAGLWSGPFGEMFNVSNVVVEYPLANLTSVKSIYVGYPDYVQLLVEIDGDLLITDAPPHRSSIILDWVTQNMGDKKITYVVPSHHHRDHAGGIADYAAAGAKVVVPEIAQDYYKDANHGKIKFITYSEAHPFTLQDEHLQFRSYWRDENPHARDWSYAAVNQRCPHNDSRVLVFNADVVSPGHDPSSPRSDGLRWDTAYARQWLVSAAKDGIPRSAIIQGAHGSTGKELGSSNTGLLQEVIDITGFDYPEQSSQAFYSPQSC
jgi:Metallo-beta-lactamase superfamily